MTGWGRRVVLAMAVGAAVALGGCTASETTEAETTATPTPTPTSDIRTPIDRDGPLPDAVDGPGSRADPLALGETISVDRVDIVIDAYEPDGDAIVEAAVNDPPPPAYHYEIVTYSVTNTHTEELYVDLISVGLVTDDDERIDERVATLTDEMAGRIPPGETLTGSRAFLVPAGAEVLIAVTPGVPIDSAYYVEP
ncbi:DUF4352 domain-containing protein [Herbiconiux sp. CPCC 203407]|uniref:DUF4352 domain-containing protein n=1 Tax=Herbiconiux oxytropis TaxID=2970915 RepID=A0AA42BT32_9MICO|nr:DUF4352 domain-containing protein [Herbiconiux oxytropis]MCS5723922.1 DUF4352 domain-containing protein [Herbiconiux oxytropis]MCS5725422.1 DUF4352 domain-containing protein [Herbiconiux oxytropis]